MGEEERFLYDQYLSRVSSINSMLFSYRAMVATVIAAYFASYKFIGEIGGESILLNVVDGTLIAVSLITSVALAAVCVVAFFDFIFQDLAEDCLEAAARLEVASCAVCQKGAYALSRKGKTTTSLRMSIVISIFYFIPALCLFMVSYYLVSMMINPIDSTLNHHFAGLLCKMAEQDSNAAFALGVDVQKLRPIGRPSLLESLSVDMKNAAGFKCGYSPEAFVPTWDVMGVVLPSYVVSAGLMAYFLLYCFWRVSNRFVSQITEFFVILLRVGYSVSWWCSNCFRDVGTRINDVAEDSDSTAAAELDVRIESARIAGKRIVRFWSLLVRAFLWAFTIYISYGFILCLLDTEYAQNFVGWQFSLFR